MKYIIRPGIASYVEILAGGSEVSTPHTKYVSITPQSNLFQQFNAVFLNMRPDGVPVVDWGRGSLEVPDAVKTAVINHFIEVFKLPVQARQAYLRKVGDIVVEV